jgi:hypothetical protein
MNDEWPGCHIKVNHKGDVQSGSSLRTEFAVEYNYRLLRQVGTSTWLRSLHSRAKEEIFHQGCGSDVDSPRDMTAVVFVVEPAVDHIKIRDS